MVEIKAEERGTSLTEGFTFLDEKPFEMEGERFIHAIYVQRHIYNSTGTYADIKLYFYDELVIKNMIEY